MMDRHQLNYQNFLPYIAVSSFHSNSNTYRPCLTPNHNASMKTLKSMWLRS